MLRDWILCWNQDCYWHARKDWTTRMSSEEECTSVGRLGVDPSVSKGDWNYMNLHLNSICQKKKYLYKLQRQSSVATHDFFLDRQAFIQHRYFKDHHGATSMAQPFQWKHEGLCLCKVEQTQVFFWNTLPAPPGPCSYVMKPWRHSSWKVTLCRKWRVCF